MEKLSLRSGVSALSLVLSFFIIVLDWRGLVGQSIATLTVQIPAGKIECFYHVAAANSPFEVEYQVISGGELDINFAIRDPNGAMIVQEQRKSDNLHRLDGRAPGEYQICFDNSFSMFQHKLVFFEVFEDKQETHVAQFHELGQGQVDTMGVKMEDLQQGLGRVHLNLEKVVKTQGTVKHLEAVDRMVLESNFERVNFYSGCQTVVMILVGVVQVVMVRSLFEERSKIGRVLRGSSSQSRTYT
ncbi:transmembrane emp24 domain-containing protein 1-like [Paramacrobiotus metropolitanus]|uniref:transmembrane emp24 domain-containing protein 1-like n=1 Tax=Paramacrobiotus metropolitanus TaxID=2943436 RepID=UPI00244607A6|nr:transmembrane emp24 domain-containing protein 1-like [Paramacrobiotus metropolitanus]